MLSLVGSDPNTRLTVFSTGLVLLTQIEKLSELLVVDDYVCQVDFINILKKPYVFVLPYISSSQSGVLYSLISNDALFIATDSGETGRVLNELGLEKLFFELDDPASFSRALQFVTNNKSEFRKVLHAYREQLAYQLKADIAGVLREL